MHDTPADDLLHYYKRELGYLREQGSAFAQRYPKVAGSLALHGDDALDPHIERLIEASAFLAARVHRDLDQSFPQVPAALLANACPSLGQPVPSMTIARMKLDAEQGKVTAGYRVPRHTGLQVRTAHGELCRFRTTWDATLWPVEVVDAHFDGADALRLTLETGEDTDFSELEIETLRFHLHGDWTETMPLYDLLIANLHHLEIHADPMSVAGHVAAGTYTTLPASAWTEVGFQMAETVLAPPDHAYLPYTLLQEYFAFPRKFHFFDLALPRGALGKGRRADIVLRLSTTFSAARTAALTSVAGPSLAVQASNFVLGCVPAINLFTRTSEPIVVDQRQYEYHLVGDQRQQAHTEIYAIESVTGIDPLTDRTVTIPPLTGSSGSAAAPGVTTRWHARREHALRPDLSGTEIFLSFVDQDNAPAPPLEQTVYATLVCTNRRLAEQVMRGARMAVEGVSQHVNVHCQYVPTSQFDPPLGSATLWRLVSLLTLNYQSLLQGTTDSKQASAQSSASAAVAADDQRTAWLQALLMLFATQGERNQKQIRGIRNVSTRLTTAHIGQDGWRGFCRGTEIAVQFDAESFVGSSPLLLSAVLSRFFAMYTSINSFARLVSRGRDETWKQWPPMSGLQPLL
jgi:type VI secretion system protein ImpG